MPKIPSRRQIKAAKQRDLNKQKALREIEKLKETEIRLKTMASGFAITTGRISAKSTHEVGKPRSSVLSPKPYRRETTRYPSAALPFVEESKETQKLSEEMQQRERQAQVEIERKKKRVGILFNKGAYQYITDETDLTTLGRK